MYVIAPEKCSHPAQLRGADGKMMCLACGGEVKTRKPPKKPEKEPEKEKTEKTAE